MKNVRKHTHFLAALVLLLLLNACTPPAQSLPYKVWADWDEMKEVLGDHYLYPTYLPEYTETCKQSDISSYYNLVPKNSKADELYYEYTAFYWSGNTRGDRMEICSTDYGRKNDVREGVTLGGRPAFEDREYYNEHTVAIGGMDVEFFSLYGTLPIPEDENDPDEWSKYHALNARIVHYSFQIDSVEYEMLWIQYNVDDKYADGEQTEEMLKVAFSIIEQVREVE